jgi:hypothetical protein
MEQKSTCKGCPELLIQEKISNKHKSPVTFIKCLITGEVFSALGIKILKCNQKPKGEPENLGE